jgi:hypothetical protein
MAREVKVAAAQLGPMEMALTTYFPKKIRDDYDQFFENEVPPKARRWDFYSRRHRELYGLLTAPVGPRP